uniref:Uncharacterized protein n=1 Tax=Oryza rufipogon TaxID=4529 RepID=A0A0E0PR81_ORYRU
MPAAESPRRNALVAKKNALVIAATTGADDINRPFLVRLLSEIGLGVRVEDNRKRRPAKTRREDWAGNRRGRQLRGDGWQRSICDTPVRRETRWAAEGEGIALHAQPKVSSSTACNPAAQPPIERDATRKHHTLPTPQSTHPLPSLHAFTVPAREDDGLELEIASLPDEDMHI